MQWSQLVPAALVGHCESPNAFSIVWWTWFAPLHDKGDIRCVFLEGLSVAVQKIALVRGFPRHPWNRPQTGPGNLNCSTWPGTDFSTSSMWSRKWVQRTLIRIWRSKWRQLVLGNISNGASQPRPQVRSCSLPCSSQPDSRSVGPGQSLFASSPTRMTVFNYTSARSDKLGRHLFWSSPLRTSFFVLIVTIDVERLAGQ